jgi:hypothetical protein
MAKHKQKIDPKKDVKATFAIAAAAATSILLLATLLVLSFVR